MDAGRIFGVLERLPCKGRTLYTARGLVVDQDDDLRSVHHETIATRVLAYKDPRFAFRVMRHLVKNNLPFPVFDVWDDEVVQLRRVYDAERGKLEDPGISMAHMLASPGMKAQRAIVDAALISDGARIPEISKQLGLRTDDIAYYEKMYFNVLDRGSDRLYVHGIAYPESGLVEYMDGYVKSAPFEKLLLRAGYKNGIQDMMYLAGLRHSRAETIAARGTSIPAKMEALIMTKGFILANNGFAGQSSFNAPVVSSARGLIAAAKAAGEQSEGAGDMEYASLAKVVAGEMLERLRQTSLVREQLKKDRNAGKAA